MTATHALAIDGGTGSCRAVIFDSRGRRVAVGQREWTHAPDPHVPGSQDFDTEANWALICACVREALATAGLDGGAVACVTATTMREGMVLLDEQGMVLWACPNVDGRAGVEAGELVESGAAATIYQRSGDWVSITAPARFLWLRRHRPDILERTGSVLMLGDWILHRLSGRAVTDPSLGSSSGMFDLSESTWSPAILRLLGLDPAVFPEVVPTGSVIGEVTQAAAAAAGLAGGTPVCAGGADTQLGLVALGDQPASSLVVIGGSFWQTAASLDQPLVDPDRRLRTLCHARPARWMIEGIGFWSGLAMRWFRDGFCRDLVAEAERGGVDPYLLIEREAAGIPPGANGVTGLFSNVMQADHWTHASPGFIGFDVSNPARTGRGACVRAIEEAAAFVAAAHRGIIEELTGRQFTDVVFTGGAAQGSLWPQVIADVIGLPARVPDMTESTALGAAVLAGVSAGLYPDADETLGEVVRFHRASEPDAGAVDAYRALAPRWATVYGRSLELAEAGITTPMWAAAGT